MREGWHKAKDDDMTESYPSGTSGNSKQYPLEQPSPRASEKCRPRGRGDER